MGLLAIRTGVKRLKMKQSKLENRAETRSKQTCWSQDSPQKVYAYGWLQGFNECLYELQDHFIETGDKLALDKIVEMIKLDSSEEKEL